MRFSLFDMTPQIIKDAGECFQTWNFVRIGPPVMHSDFFALLVSEARRQRAMHIWPDWLVDSATSRILKNTIRGELSRHGLMLLESTEIVSLINAITNLKLAVNHELSGYTYYDYPGSVLARHTDHPQECVITLLIALESTWPAGMPVPAGNQLYLHLRETESPKRITTMPNSLIILNGKTIPHERPALVDGQRVSIMSICFRER